MANSFDSNFTEKLAKKVLTSFESKRVLSKNVNTQLLSGQFNPDSGETIKFKRPTDYTSSRTSGGNVTSVTPDSIIRGSAVGTVQDYMTVLMDFNEADQALKMGNDENEFFDAAASRIVTDLEVDFANFMKNNSGLLSGAVGQAVNTWGEVANAGAVMAASGVPAGDLCYGVNPYTQTALADVQRSLGAVDPLVSEAHRDAIISKSFAGMKVITATTLASHTTGAGADRAGTLSAAPTPTYLAAKDTMTQSIAVTAFQANLVVAAGETITIAGCNRLNLNTRQPMIDAAGAKVPFTGVVTATVTLNGSGAGTLVIAGPAIYEATGAHNTVDAAAASGAVVTLGGAASTLYQPNLFWAKDAFSIGSVPIMKLYSTDTIATTKDGLQMRISKYADGDANKQTVRIDIRPAYACLNPFMAGQGFGIA